MAPADNHNTSGQYDPSVHSTDGINSVSLTGFPHPIDQRIIKTTSELKDEFPFNLDMNSGDHLGVGEYCPDRSSVCIGIDWLTPGWIQATINGGRRSSSATSYLAHAFRNRPNLHVLINARVTRILKTGNTLNGKLAFRTVEFVQIINGE